MYSPVLRLGTVGAGNDHRLGANEAPPAIISVYLGEQLTAVLHSLVNGEAGCGRETAERPCMEIGVSSLPPLPKDLSDRNRTSPFAFTGNKFEFRAVGSSQSAAPINIALNAAMACALDDIATELEAGVREGMPLASVLQRLLPRLFREHMGIVFNGNGYADAWKEEAAKRRLPNLSNSVDALERYSDPQVMDVFLRHGVLSEREILARQEILLEGYAKTINIEANLTAGMARSSILPVALKAQADAAELVLRTRAVLGGAAAPLPEEERFNAVRGHAAGLAEALKELDAARAGLHAAEGDSLSHATWARDRVLPAMAQCRKHADALEELLDDADWPLPKYAELMWMH